MSLRVFFVIKTGVPVVFEIVFIGVTLYPNRTYAGWPPCIIEKRPYGLLLILLLVYLVRFTMVIVGLPSLR